MYVSSPAFEAGDQLPFKYTKHGEDISPPLTWSVLPKKSRELAVLFEQFGPASDESFVHWVIYRIPADLGRLPEGFKHRRDPKEPADVVQGTNSLGNVGYDGPIGTISRNLHYRFRVYALDEALPLPEGLGREALLEAMKGHILDEGELPVDYQRKD